MTSGERADVERLRAYWDGVVHDDPTVPTDLDPDTAAVVSQLRTWYRPAQPDPAFRARLQEEIMHSPPFSPVVLAPDATWTADRIVTNPIGRASSASRCRLRFCPPAGRGQMLGHFASAALVLIMLVAAYMAFGPSRHAGAPTGPSVNMPALQAPATPAPGDMAGEAVLETTNFGLAYELPTTPAKIEMSRAVLPPGARISIPLDNLTLHAYVIESGTITINMSLDVPVTRDGESHGLVYGWEDNELAPGDGFVVKPNVGGEIRNDGTEPVMYVVIHIVPETPEEPASAPGL